MSFKYIKPIRIIAYILTALFLIGAIWFGLAHKNAKININHLQQEVNILMNYKLNEPFLKSQIVALENDNTKLKQQLENLNIHYAADELFITYVKGEYMEAVTWINIAELVFDNNNITFPLYLGDKKLIDNYTK